MSVEAMAWAFKQEIDDAQTKLILLALCDHADEDGLCWPSLERVAKKAACSHDTATRRIHDLEKLGFVAKRRRARKTTMYRILLNKKAMNTQHMRNHDLAPTETEKGEMLRTQDDLMNTQNALDDNATGACVTIKGNHQSKPSLFPSDDGKPEKRRKRRSGMPQNWEPDAAGIVFAKVCGFDERKISQLVVACRDYHLKHGTLIADFPATWRTWCNNEVKFTAEREARYGSKSSASRPTRSETILAGSRDFAAQMARHRGGAEVSVERSDAADNGRASDHHAPTSRH